MDRLFPAAAVGFISLEEPEGPGATCEQKEKEINVIKIVCG